MTQEDAPRHGASCGEMMLRAVTVRIAQGGCRGDSGAVPQTSPAAPSHSAPTASRPTDDGDDTDEPVRGPVVETDLL